MKNPLLIIVVLICLSYNSFSQSPQSFKYQAIVRDNSGNILQNHNVTFRVSIQQSTAFTDVYIETHAVTTNNFGLANLEIGTGTIVSGDFASIDWGSDVSYLQVEIDTSGGVGFQIMGVSQLLSVPYALYSEKSGNGSLWQQGSNGIYYDSGNVGVGTISPNGRFQVNSDTTAGINDVIFSVLNANGDTVFAVYQEGVRIWVDDNGGTKANGSRGGFAVGGFSPTKAGFTNEYLRVTPDSVRIYIDETYVAAKANGSRGGFAVGGFSPAKGTNTDNYLVVSLDTTETINPSEPRVVWYPTKEAFLVGRALIEDKDSVGINSFASGFESKAIGNYSQALGYHARAFGNNSTAIGNNTNAEGDESYALGNFANSNSLGSYAFGSGALANGDYSFALGSTGVDSAGATTSPTIANGNYSYAFGMGSIASSNGSFAFGTVDSALGVSSLAMGYKTKATNFYSTSFGAYTISTNLASTAFGYRTEALSTAAIAGGYFSTASGLYSVSLGYYNIASGDRTLALGSSNTASGSYSIAIGDKNEASGSHSIVIGDGSIANFSNSIAIGYQDTATGAYAIAMGYRSKASGQASTSIGSGNIASGYSAFAAGFNSLASGSFATALGSQSIASGSYSFSTGYKTNASYFGTAAFGFQSIASGKYSFTSGYESTSQAYASAVFGQYNIISGNPDSWLTGDDLFVIGNGTSDIARNNAFTVLKGGNVGIGTPTPLYNLHVTGTGTKATILVAPDIISSGESAELILAEDHDYTFGMSIIYDGGVNQLQVLAKSNLTYYGPWLTIDRDDGEVRMPQVYADIVGATNRDLYIDNAGKIGYLSSSKRYKKEISNMENIDWLYKLRPVNYTYKNDNTNIKQFGLIAEEVEKVNPLFVSYNEKGKVETVLYSQFISPMLKAIQEQKARITELENENNNLKSEMNNRLEKIESLLNSTAKK